MSQPKIAKIVIEIAGAELSLSVEDAKALQKALNDLLQTARIEIREKEYVPSYPWWPSPYWFSTTPDRALDLPKVTCAAQFNNSSFRLPNS